MKLLYQRMLVYIKPSIWILLLTMIILLFMTVSCNDDDDDNANNNTSDNQPPIANAGPDQTHVVGQTIQLDGSGSSDPEGDTLTFNWQIILKPENSTVSLNDPTLIRPEFTVDLAGTYIFSLVVSDGELLSDADVITSTSINAEPVANAGSDQNATLGALVTLDGSASFDSDGNPLTYLWTLTPPADSHAILDNNALIQPSFVVDVEGTYRATLIVNDGTVNSPADEVIITTDNAKPTAVIIPTDPTNVEIGQEIILDGQNSFDPEGNNLSFTWALTSQPNNSTANLANIDQITTGLTPCIPTKK